MKPDRVRVLTDGLITGLLGYLAVVLFFGVVNLISGRSFFYTAALLGQGLVGGNGAPGNVTVTPAAVYAFNGLHLLVFLLIGLVAAWLVMQTERNPSFFVLALFIGLAGFFGTMALFVSAAASTSGALSIGSVIAANLLAGVGMGTYLVRAHPRLWVKIRDHLDPEAEHPAPH